MKRFLLVLCTVFIAAAPLAAQPSGNGEAAGYGTRERVSETALAPNAAVRERVKADWNLACGLDGVRDWSPRAMTAAPRGYEATYISHYGRHGSRYAYTELTYTEVLDMFRDGAATGNLTEFGADFLGRLESLWEHARYRVGDLTRKGWEQHARIARTMVSCFPKAFVRGSRVDACSSPSTRSIVSMASFVAAVSKAAPETDVYAHQGITDVQATRPNTGKNPFRYQGPELAFPYQETSAQFFLRRFPEYPEVLGRFFKDTEAGLGGRKPFDAFFYLYMLVAGMNSLDDDVRMNMDGVFTPEEFATLWEIDNYERFNEYFSYRTPCSSIIDDMIAKADARLAAGERGADLRFGHDHVVMALMMIMDIDNFNEYPANPDELIGVFQTFRSPMATNIQLVFYTPCKCRKGDTLVKVLLNGEEVRLGSLQASNGPYYRWEDLKEYLKARVRLFVN